MKIPKPQQQPRSGSPYLSAAVSAVLSLAAASAHGDPRNGVVASGSATISTPDANLTQIDQSSHSASINWQSFDVAAQERVIFNQPCASSVALNRIQAQDPSQIYGSIAANGRVFLINPNGIIFGASARINVGSLVASSLDLTAADAESGHYAFNATSAQSGAIVNSGQITAAHGGSVSLLGGSVLNNGLIVANYGSVNLGAGRAATLDFAGDGLVRFQIDAGLLSSASGASAAVDNTGEIVAAGGQVLLTARQANDVIARAVNNDGVIRAARIENVGGRIRLLGPEGSVVNSGTLDAAGAGATSTGGDVQVLGAQVALSGTSIVDVSGSAGGGTALIGGSFGGADTTILNARQTDVQAGAIVRADSLVSGDAGQVAIWSDGTTTFNGDILARAFGSSGNGGRAEVSGREHLRIVGHAWLQSSHADAGTLLLDPGSITITAGADTAPAGDNDIINDDWVIGQLAGSNLTIQTNSSANGLVEDLIVDGTANISWANGRSLTLRGDNSVTLAAGSNIANTGTGSLTLQSGGAVAIDGTVTLVGDLSVDAGADITQAGPLAIAGTASFVAGTGQSVVLDNAGNAFTGVVSIDASSGNLQDVTVRDSTALDLQALVISGDLDVTAAALTQSGLLNVGGTSSFAAAAGQSILLTNAGNRLTGIVSFAASTPGRLQNVTLQNLTAIDLQGLTLSGSLTAIAAGGITQAGALVVDGNSSFTAAGGQSIVLGNSGNAFTGTVSLVSSGPGSLQNVTLRDSTALDLQALTIGGNLDAGSAASLTQSGVLNIGGSSTFTAGDGDSITLNTVGNVFNGSVGFASGGPGNLQDVAVTDSIALQLRALTIDGTLTVGANAVTQAGALVVGGNSSFTVAGGQSVVLGDAGNVFTGAVSLAASGGGNLQNVTLTDTTALQLQALTLNGNLAASSGAALTQSGALVVGGNSTFTAGSGDSITLANTGNSFAGTVSFASGGLGNLLSVTVNDSNALDLQALAIDGALNVTAGGALSQSGTLSIGGAASFRTLNDAGAAITLDGINSFGSVQAAVRNAADTANGAADIVIHESNGTSLGNVQTAAGRSVSVTSGGAIAALAGTAITTGSLSLVAAGDIGSATTSISLLAPTGSISAVSSGSVHLAHTGGAGSNVALNQVVAGSTGDIDLASDGNVRVSDVRAGGSVTLTSTGGSILDDNVNGAGSQLVANAVTLQAAGSIGEATGVGSGMLDLQTASVSANAQGGGIHLDQAQGDLGIRQLSAAGPVSIQAAAGSILDDPADATAASITSSTGGVQLRALNNIGTVTDLSTRQGTPIGINTNGGAISAQVTSATGQINLGIAGGSALTASAGAIAAGGSGRLLMQSTGDLSPGAFNSAITGFSEVGFSSDATLRLPDSPAGLLASPVSTLLVRGATDIVRTGRVFDLGAGHLIFESGALGGDVTLNTNVGLLDATLGNGANLSVVQAAGALTLGSVGAGGNVSIRAATILDDGDLNAVTRIFAGDAISLHADNGIGAEDGTAGGRIDTASNSVAVVADAGPVFISHLGDLQISGTASGGLIDIAAPTGSITVNSSLRATGPLTLAAGTNAGGAGAAVTGNITLSGSVQTDDTMVLTARGGGVIADANDSSTHLTARDANLTATLIGSQANVLNVDVGSLSASAPNGLHVSAANAVQLRSIAGADVVINAAGNISDDGDAQTGIVASSVELAGTAIGAAGAGNDIHTSVDRLSATASNGGIYVGQTGSIELGAVTAAGAGNDIAITASGAITDDGDNATRISGGNLSLSAASIGSAAASGELDAQVSSLTATASGGGIYIGEADDLQLRAISAAGNDIVLSAAGALTDDSNDATKVTGAGISLIASAVGATDNRIDTAATVLSAAASNGGIYIEEADNVTLADVRSSGTGNTVNLHTSNNGNVIVQNLVTQGGAVNLTAGGTGSLNVTGTLESNNGVVNLTSGDVLAVPGLDTGTGSAVLHTVNDVNVGAITASSISITSDTGSVLLGTANAGTGTVVITASNGAITDSTATSVTAGQATLSARSIGSADNPLNVAIGTLTASASAGGVFIDDTVGLTVKGISATGPVSLATRETFIQAGSITSAGSAISVLARSIDMDAATTTISGGADIRYIANGDDANISVLDAAGGRVLVIAADNVFSSLGSTSATNNLSGAAVEVRAGGLAAGSGQIGTIDSPLAISTPAGGRNAFLVVPALNGIQTTTPNINYSGSPASLLLKGYTGSGGALLFDPASAFTSDTVLLNGESIVPLRNGRVAVNTDSLSAAKQALSSGVISRVNIDWAAFDPNVSLFGTLDPALRLPSDQLDEVVPAASLLPPGSALVVKQDVPGSHQ